MKWQFWLAHGSSSPQECPDGCEDIRPLLSLMSDNLASAREKRRAETHVAACDACRQAQAWMNATRLAIAERPPVLPPVDMRARIARAIAASAETAVPVEPIAVRTVPRTFISRPAFAAALSLAVAAAFFGYALLPEHHAGTAPVIKSPVAVPVPIAAQTTPATVIHKTHAPQMASARPPRTVKLAPRPLAPVVAFVPEIVTLRPAHHAPPAAPASLNFAVKPRTEVVPERVVHHSAPQFAAIVPRKTPVLATHHPDTTTLVATVPPPVTATVAGPLQPSPTETPAPTAQVARVETPVYTPSHAYPVDGVRSLRALLPSRHDDIGRHLSMDQTGVVHTASFVQGPITYLTDKPTKAQQ